MTWTYAKFIEKYGDKYGKDCIKETEDEFNAIIKAEKARLKLNGKIFRFECLYFHFKFGENYEKMQVRAYENNPSVPTSERQKNKGEKAKEREANPETSNYNTEAMSIKRLKEIINDSNLEFKDVGREGHFVDIAGRKKGSSRQTWFPVQMKASKAVIPTFDMDYRYNCPEKFKNTYERFGYYENMIVICHNVKIDEFLIIPPYSKKIPNTCLKYNSGVNKGYYVKKEDIVAKINEYIEKYQELEKPFSDIELLCSKKKQLEIKYIRKRQETFSKVFYMKEIDYGAVDFEIDEIVRVQEKAKNHTDVKGNSFNFKLEKSDEKDTKQPYSIDDNDFYWLNLAGTDYFYVIPSKLMEKDGKIRKTLTLHKEFYPKRQNGGRPYTDAWTYAFRFDWTKLLQENIEYEKEVNRLWCLVREINLSETFIIDQLSL
ncbi:hypothetical protein JO84_gp333 [Aureococcus anophagefferens virus]|uniref:Uncharacterized protein n=1 Tax=Aureococcus anophagefferens virus TaxID=1474867 RepID=A0A076FM60_9VIRU|nr:hypothetical protein JO84_gp333 [Aureococcus anophagefferens virus]AII16963.1 hypothetical protein AaV_140 [Aureococcus anophagefferens virus]UOG94054.1 hypothetical protein MKD35_12 [Aureococcus anophagefferens virus]